MASPRDSALAKPSTEGGGEQQQRNVANFSRPLISADRFLQYDSNSYSVDAREKDLILRVNIMLSDESTDTLVLLQLIDQLQRSGVAYRFQDAIHSRLGELSEKYRVLVKGRGRDDDLHMVSLLFRLLRQHGYHVSSDVFEEFKDPATGKFRESLAGNTLGVLSLFEASHMLVHEERILQEALDFTSAHLNSVDDATGSLFITKLARHALIQPIRRGYPRLEAWRYICICQDDDASVNKTVLALAKLDFNSLQKLHQKEICDLVRWWKDGAFMDNLPFLRDRIVESYLWVLGIYFEPEHSAARRFVTKVLIMVSIVDDMFDAYGKPEELELFAEALVRGDSSTMDGLPESMKFDCRKLADVYNEMEEEMARRGCSYCLHYGKQWVKDHTKGYLTEAKWFREKYTPLLDEYIEVAATTVGVKALALNSLVGMGDVVTEDALEWLSCTPRVMQSLMTASRYWNDIVGYKFEQERGHVVSSIHCMVKEYGCTEREAEEMLWKRVSDLWKDMNEACLRPLSAPMTVLERILNWFRSMSLMYGDGADNYTQSTVIMKDVGIALLVDSLPL